MIAENVKKVFDAQTWVLATCGPDGPNAVPVGFHCVTDDGKFAVGAVLLETTLVNVADNGRIAIAVFDPATAEAYQVKGRAGLVKEGPVFDYFAKLTQDTFKGALSCKGALMVTPEKLIVASPNGENKKELPL